MKADRPVKTGRSGYRYFKYCLTGILICFITAFLFYDLSIVSVAVFAAVPFIVRTLKKKNEEKERWDLNVAFADGLKFVKNGLAAGYSVEKSLGFAAEELGKLYGSNALITREFRKMRSRMHMGIPVEEAVAEFAERSDVEDIKEFSEVFAVLKRTGGNLSGVIKQSVTNLQEKIDLRRDINIVAAEKQGEFRIMCLIPYGILAYLRFFSPSLCEPLYHNTVGVLFMTGALVTYVFCIRLGNRILSDRMKE
ncbi:MAG: type II secretion system F family protein [Lachnospiraceae bacterium]|nr:type II secretion system F family protein [Lachnospiraceae bacterium]